MQTNPVYDGVQKTQYELLERQYEQPHQDTWSASAYDTGGEKLQSPVAYDQVVLDDGYEKPHPNTWLPQNYEIIERGGLTYTAPDPINPIDLNQDPWGFGEEV